MSNPSLQIRYNPMQLTSISAFVSVNGSYHEPIKDVYFIRLIGCKSQAALLQDLAQAEQRLQQNGSHAVRILQFPPLPATAQLTDYASHWQENDQTLHFHAEDALLRQTIEQRIAELPALYRRYYPTSSDSMLKNFMVKILFWADIYFPQLFTDWNARRSPKLICSGQIKKQEYCFLYLLTQLGCDVLYLNPQCDLNLDAPLLALSALVDHKHYEAVQLPAPRLDQSSQTQQPTTSARQPSQAKQPAVPAHPPTQTQQPTTARAEKSFEQLAQLAASVVMIEVLDQNEQCFKTGSGIVIHPDGYILTNFHVACDSSHYRIKLEGDEQAYHSETLIKYDYVHDLALLRIDRTCSPLPIYREAAPLIRGQKVVAIGSPLGLFNSVSDGIISGFRSIQDTAMVQFTAPTSPGSSGGALLNMQGEVIGICTAGMNEGQNLNLAVDYQTILTFLRGFLPL